MDKKKVHEVVRLCDELKKRAERWEYAAYHDWKGNPRNYEGWASKESGALRRISMELTRACRHEAAEVKLYTGDRVIDNRGRELCLSHRTSVAGRKGWLAYPVRREKVQRGHNSVVLDTEIRAVLSESGQFILAR